MYNVTVTTNYPDDELESVWDFETIDAVISFIKDDLKKETEATSFTYTIVPRR